MRSPKQLWNSERNYRYRGSLIGYCKNLIALSNLPSVPEAERVLIQSAIMFLEQTSKLIKDGKLNDLSFKLFCQRKGLKSE